MTTRRSIFGLSMPASNEQTSRTLSPVVIFLLLLVVTGFMVGRFLERNPSSFPYETVIKINVYRQDPIFGTVSVVAGGSAVAISDRHILTNSHVILKEGKPTDIYEVCITTGVELVPECGHTAYLYSYHRDFDLAVLTLAPKTFSHYLIPEEQHVDLGDSISVLGYPGLGGETITNTQGVVAGFDGNRIKIDAGVNRGNSGGPVFAENGSLIGLATSVKTDVGSLGYVIDTASIVDMIRERVPGIVKHNPSPLGFSFYHKSWKNLGSRAGRIGGRYLSARDDGDVNILRAMSTDRETRQPTFRHDIETKSAYTSMSEELFVRFGGISVQKLRNYMLSNYVGIQGNILYDQTVVRGSLTRNVVLIQTYADDDPDAITFIARTTNTKGYAGEVFVQGYTRYNAELRHYIRRAVQTIFSTKFPDEQGIDFSSVSLPYQGFSFPLPPKVLVERRKDNNGGSWLSFVHDDDYASPTLSYSQTFGIQYTIQARRMNDTEARKREASFTDRYGRWVDEVKSDLWGDNRLITNRTIAGGCLRAIGEISNDSTETILLSVPYRIDGTGAWYVADSRLSLGSTIPQPIRTSIREHFLKGGMEGMYCQ